MSRGAVTKCYYSSNHVCSSEPRHQAALVAGVQRLCGSTTHPARSLLRGLLKPFAAICQVSRVVKLQHAVLASLRLACCCRAHICRVFGELTVRRVAGRLHFAVHQQSFIDVLPQVSSAASGAAQITAQ